MLKAQHIEALTMAAEDAEQHGNTFIAENLRELLAASAAPAEGRKLPPVRGVGRVFDNSYAVLVYLKREPTADDLRSIQAALSPDVVPADGRPVDERAAFFDVVFDGPPSRESGRFVEVEDEAGRSFNAGEWIDRGNGLWALRIGRAAHATAPGATPAEYETAVETLRHVIHCLRATGSYTDEEGEATDYLEPLLSIATAPTMSEAVRDVLAERKRSVERYGFTAERDDRYDPGILAAAGLAYAMWSADYLHPYSLGDGDRDREGQPPMTWPWSPKWWKPKTPRVALVKACNLLIAEIERMDRAAANGKA